MLGLPESEARALLACIATQEKPAWHTLYTSPLRKDVEARERAVDMSRAALAGATTALSAAAANNDRDGITAATTDISNASAAIAKAKKKVNHPINLAFSESGCQKLCHALDICHEASPWNDTISDDIKNMYNTTDTGAMFQALREHQPHLVPVYRVFYWRPSPIWLERCDGQLRRQSVTVDSDSIDSSLNDTGAAWCLCSSDACTVGDPFLYGYACMGGHQGCPLATNGCILPHHTMVLNDISKEYPDVIILGDADDTYYNAPSTSVHAAFARKRQLARDVCGHESHLGKVCAYSPTGDLAGKPDDYASVDVFKAVGAYMGDPAAVKKKTTERLLEKLKPLDNLDQARDTETVNNVAQLKRILITHCAANQSTYTAQTTPPTRADAAAHQLGEAHRGQRHHRVLPGARRARVAAVSAARERGRLGNTRHPRQGGTVLVRLGPPQLARAAAHAAALRRHRHHCFRAALLR